MLSDQKKKKFFLCGVFKIIFRGYYPKMQQFNRNLFFKDPRNMKSLHGYVGVFYCAIKL